jgi:hypothetical protein
MSPWAEPSPAGTPSACLADDLGEMVAPPRAASGLFPRLHDALQPKRSTRLASDTQTANRRAPLGLAVSRLGLGRWLHRVSTSKLR